MALLAFLEHDAIGDQHQMFHQHRAANRKNQRQPKTESNKGKKRDGNVNRREQESSARRRERAQLPGEKHGQHAEENDERQFQRQRRAADELPGDDGIGDVPILADEESVAFQRRRAAVGQVVALRRRTDDDELVAKVVDQAVGLAGQPLFVLPEQAFNRRAEQMRVVRRQPPINEKIAVGINGNCSLDSVCAAQNDFSLRQIHFGVLQIKMQCLCGEDDAHLPDALVGEGFGPGRDAGREFVADQIGEGKIVSASTGTSTVFVVPVCGKIILPGANFAFAKSKPKSSAACLKSGCQLR